MAGLLLSRSTGLLVTNDRHGRSPLHLSAAYGHHQLAELLLGQGADIDAEDRVSVSFLFFFLVRSLTESFCLTVITHFLQVW